MSEPRLTPHQARVVDLLRAGRVLLPVAGWDSWGLFERGGRVAERGVAVRPGTIAILCRRGLLAAHDRRTGEPVPLPRDPSARVEYRAAPELEAAA